MQPRRSPFRTDILRTIKLDLNDKDKALSTIRDYDRSNPWIYVGSGSGAPAFQNSWVNYSTGSDGNPTAAFMRDASGIVHLRGVVKNGSAGVAIFTLPEGFRPDHTATGNTSFLGFPVVTGANVFGVVYVLSNGTVRQDAGSNANVDLSAIQFPAEL